MRTFVITVRHVSADPSRKDSYVRCVARVRPRPADAAARHLVDWCCACLERHMDGRAEIEPRHLTIAHFKEVL